MNSDDLVFQNVKHKKQEAAFGPILSMKGIFVSIIYKFYTIQAYLRQPLNQ
jgi:hypothetical protein